MTGKQQIFILEYLKDFNATQAAIRAGYSSRTAYSIGNELLRKPEIKQAIDTVMTERRNKLIATREQRQEFWTTVMTDEEQDMRIRLRASELLGKSEGDFTERVQVQDDSATVDIDARIRRLLLKTEDMSGNRIREIESAV